MNIAYTHHGARDSMTSTPETWTFDFPGRRIPGGHLITARSHLVDRYRTECAQIWLPPREAETGQYTIEAGILAAKPPASRMPTLLAQKPPKGTWFFDMRHQDPENFAHFLNNHLPTFFIAAEVAERDWRTARLLLPPKTPEYILQIAALFGLETVLTRKTVKGEGVTFSATPWTALRSERAAWVALPAPQAALKGALAASEAAPLPRKVFLSRKSTRALENAAEIENWLTDRGFETVIPEELPVIDQMRLFREADQIVAIHGAALAPLLYCTPEARPDRLIEILPVGHMTDVYREMAHLVGCDWIGVQGRMKPGYVQGLYDLDTPFTKHSLDSFEVDPASLELAFEMMSRRE